MASQITQTPKLPSIAFGLGLVANIAVMIWLNSQYGVKHSVLWLWQACSVLPFFVLVMASPEPGEMW